MDRVSPKCRSDIMVRVKSHRNKSTEWRLRSFLVRAGINGWHLCAAEVLGKPDFVFTEKRLAVFVDGCFWHGCPKCCRMPRTNKPYWVKKIARNRRRDAEVTKRLRQSGWLVFRIRECELREQPERAIKKFKKILGAAVSDPHHPVISSKPTIVKGSSSTWISDGTYRT